MARTGEIRIGTSGWTYDHWIGPVYPEGMPAQDRLAHYALSLDSVEVNSTFYGLPSAASIDAWLAATPEHFVFAVKASRYVTHMKKLKEPEAALARFFAAIEPLGKRLGPILFQLPPRWRVNAARLDAFLETLPRGYRYAFEFRDPSWHGENVVEVLERQNAAFCNFEFAGTASPCIATADFAYIRLHGPREAYRGRYGDAALRKWAARIDDWRAAGLDTYCYFDNDESGYAFENAVRLSGMVDRTR